MNPKEIAAEKWCDKHLQLSALLQRHDTCFSNDFNGWEYRLAKRAFLAGDKSEHKRVMKHLTALMKELDKSPVDREMVDYYINKIGKVAQK